MGAFLEEARLQSESLRRGSQTHHGVLCRPRVSRCPGRLGRRAVQRQEGRGPPDGPHHGGRPPPHRGRAVPRIRIAVEGVTLGARSRGDVPCRRTPRSATGGAGAGRCRDTAEGAGVPVREGGCPRGTRTLAAHGDRHARRDTGAPGYVRRHRDPGQPARCRQHHPEAALDSARHAVSTEPHPGKPAAAPIDPVVLVCVCRASRR